MSKRLTVDRGATPRVLLGLVLPGNKAALRDTRETAASDRDTDPDDPRFLDKTESL